jgi:hypothetical protein
MLGAKLKDFPFKPRLDGYAIKVPVISFDKFPNVDKSLGPEMKSTGEAIYYQGSEGGSCPERSRGVLPAGVWGALC